MLHNINFIPFIVCYIVINLIAIYLVYGWLYKRINSQLLAWLFSISLCLGTTFLIALLVLYAILRW